MAAFRQRQVKCLNESAISDEICTDSYSKRNSFSSDSYESEQNVISAQNNASNSSNGDLIDTSETMWQSSSEPTQIEQHDSSDSDDRQKKVQCTGGRELKYQIRNGSLCMDFILILCVKTKKCRTVSEQHCQTCTKTCPSSVPIPETSCF
jgi:anti-sigma28 factor (negative regulator of flagellin synthesis)